MRAFNFTPGALRPLLRSVFSLAVFIIIATDTDAKEREYAVGFSTLTTTDPLGGPLHYSLWYPTHVPNGIVRAGPIEFPGTRNAEPASGQFGLVVLSHGSGGSNLGHWDTALALVKAGFIAAAPLHPRNNFRDDVHDDHRLVLDGRPLQFSAVIDALLAQDTWSTRIDPGRIGAFGFSAGGYTVLAALGTEREYTRTLEHCDRHAEADPYCRIINGPGRASREKTYADPPRPSADGRLCAAVLIDPLTTPFSDAALRALPQVRLLIFRPETEDALNVKFHASRIIRLTKERGDFPEPREIVVPGANHFSFLAPIPNKGAKSRPGIESEPKGIDRVAFRDGMNQTIVAFFEMALSDCAGN